MPPICDNPPERIRLAAPPTRPPVKNAAPVLAIGVRLELGATRFITSVINDPAPIPLTTSPITPVFKDDAIPLPVLRALGKRFFAAIGCLRGVALLVLFFAGCFFLGAAFLFGATFLAAAFLPLAIRCKNSAFFLPVSLAK